VLAAADGYSYIHLVIVAGIIVFAVGVHFIVLEPTHALADAARLTLCGGVALYLAGHLAFRLRMVGSFEREKALVVVALLVLYAVGGGIVAWGLAAITAALLGLLCVAESGAEL